MKRRELLHIAALCAFLLFSHSNLILADEPFSMSLCVPMHSNAPANLPSSSRPSAVCGAAPCGTSSTYRAPVNHRYLSSRATASRTSSLSLGYSSALPFLHSNASVKSYAPPSAGSGGAAGKAIANWIDTYASSAWLYSNNGVQYYDINALQSLFSSLGGISDMPNLTWDEFLQWFNDANQTQYRAPFGEPLLPLLLCLLAYTAFIARRKQQPSQKH